MYTHYVLVVMKIICVGWAFARIIRFLQEFMKDNAQGMP